jgi:hypothetical protein
MCRRGELLDRPWYSHRIKKPSSVTEAARIIQDVPHIVIEMALLTLDQETRTVSLENFLRSVQDSEFVTLRVTLDKSHRSIAIA